MSMFTATPSQEAAQAARGRTLVAAAAGSGKTTVLTNRIYSALVDDHVPPAQIIAVTFTNDAAQEIRSRVQEQLLKAGKGELLELLGLATIGTIHGLCGRLVREHGTVIGVDPGVAILDEAQANLLRRQAFDDACDVSDDDTAIVRLRTRITDDKLLTMLRRLRSRGGTMVGVDLQFPSGDGDAALRMDLEHGVVVHGEVMSRLNERFLDGYIARCQAAGAVDFDDLQVMAYQLLQHEHVRTAVRARYTQVLVDEFQDTDTLQEQILSLIGDRELFMVGDEWQSIYGFRGADVDVFRAVAGDEAVAGVAMRENFRSSPGILAVVNAAFGADHVFGDRYDPVIAGTEAVDLAPGLAGPAVTVLEAPRPGGAWSDDPSEEDIAAGAPEPPESRYRPEGELIAERIATLITAGAKPDDVAVIARSRTHMESLSLALGEWGIPALVSSAGSVFDDPDVIDVVALLSWVHRSIDDAAALVVLSSPFASSSWDTIVELRTRAGDDGSLWSAMHESADATVRELAIFVNELRAHARDGSIVGVVERAITHPRFAAAVLG
ncbi:MAG: UvrD-helicase domain-containing protein, partial [Thermoleophilia bacterium]|nr:UvrD-helicase domain-containing protein [Thermoleophilia bacterium]